MADLSDEELDQIESICDGLQALQLNANGQRDVRALIAEVRRRRSSPPSTGVVLTESDREALRWLYSSLYGGVAGRSVLMIRGDARPVLDRLLAAPAGGQGER